MNPYFLPAFAMSLLGAGAAILGVIAIHRCRGWITAHLPYFISFTAGVLITVSLLHLVPEALTMSARGAMFLLLGYFLMHVINRLLHGHICAEGAHHHYHIGIMTMVGIGFHSFVDGVVYSITFGVSLFTGVLASIGMVLHKFVDGVVTYTMLMEGGFAERKARIFAFATAAVTTPLGMLISYPLILRIDEDVLGALLAVAGGALLYVGATHLLPHAEREPKRFSFVAMGAGILIAALIAFGDTHDHGRHGHVEHEHRDIIFNTTLPSSSEDTEAAPAGTP